MNTQTDSCRRTHTHANPRRTHAHAETHRETHIRMKWQAVVQKETEKQNKKKHRLPRERKRAIGVDTKGSFRACHPKLTLRNSSICQKLPTQLSQGIHSPPTESVSRQCCRRYVYTHTRIHTYIHSTRNERGECRRTLSIDSFVVIPRQYPAIPRRPCQGRRLVWTRALLFYFHSLPFTLLSFSLSPHLPAPICSHAIAQGVYNFERCCYSCGNAQTLRFKFVFVILFFDRCSFCCSWGLRGVCCFSVVYVG